MNIPFSEHNFAQDAKPLLGGINTTLEYENVESSLQKAAMMFADHITETVYEAIRTGTITSDASRNAVLADLLKRALLHFGIYNSIDYLAVHIGNEGITTFKSDDQTTAYKYQTDELKARLLNDGWYWMGKLIDRLNEYNPASWQAATKKNGIADLPITALDMERYVGVSSVVFVYFAASIIREVYDGSVRARGAALTNEKVKEALCNEVMGKAIKRLPYNMLPDSVRLDINNEQTKSNQESPENNIRERMGTVYLNRAADMWAVIDKTVSVAPAAAYKPQKPKRGDKFVM